MGPGRRTTLLASLMLVSLAVSACNRKVLEVLVDLPPSQTSSRPQGQALAAPPGGMLPPLYLTPVDTVVPEIERTLDPDSVVAMLPRDHAGNIDWMAALRQEVIRPRNGIDGPRESAPDAFEFGFDFYFPGPNPMFDAFFPHSAHTEWLSCAQCHPRIFKTRPVEIQMADVFAGRYCGECHGTVAYPVMTGCERCHTDLPQPPDRAEPELIGTITMGRADEILAARNGDTLAVDGSSIAGNAVGVSTASLPKAQFPHWVHRIRYRCKTCHMEIFEPEAGTNAITMVDIGNGEACGQCHDGDTAFEPQMDNCERCHVPPGAAVATPAASPGGSGTGTALAGSAGPGTASASGHPASPGSESIEHAASGAAAWTDLATLKHSGIGSEPRGSDGS